MAEAEKTISEIISEIKCKTPEQLLADGWKDVTDPRKVQNTLSKQ